MLGDTTERRIDQSDPRSDYQGMNQFMNCIGRLML